METENKLPPPSKEEIFHAIDEMIKSYEKLPPGALFAPVTHEDHYSLLLLVRGLFKGFFDS